MIIRSVTLRNIRSYTHAHIDFPTGSSVLSGDIGSGKTSILLAIEFGIFGARRGELSASALLRNGAKDASVILELELEGHRVAIERSLKRGKNGIAQEAGSITIDGMRTDATPIELNATIVEMLGYPTDVASRSGGLVFRYTVYTPQEEMRAILFDEPDERLSTIRRIFGIDKYQRIVANAESYIKNVRSDARAKRALLEDLHILEDKRRRILAQKHALLVEIDSAKAQAAAAGTSHARAQELMAELETHVRAYREARQEIAFTEASLLEKRTRHASLKIQLQGAQEQLANAITQLQRIPAHAPTPQELKARIAEIQGQIENLREQTGAVSGSITLKQQERESIISLNIPTALSGLQERMKTLDAAAGELPGVEKSLLGADEEIAVLRAKAHSIDEQIAVAQATKAGIVNLESCPLCFQRVDASHRQHIVEKANKDLMRLAPEKQHAEEGLAASISRKTALQSRMQELAEQVVMRARTEEQISRLEEKALRLEALGQEIRALEEERQGLRAQPLDEWTSRIRQLQDELVLVSKSAELHLVEKSARARVHELEAEQGVVESAIAELVSRISFLTKRLPPDDVLLRFEAAQKQERKERALAESARTAVAEKDREFSFILLQESEVEQTLGKRREAERELRYLGELETWLGDGFIALMRTIEQQIFLHIHAQLSGVFCEWFGILMEEENLTVRLDETFSPVIEQNGYETSVLNLSGGEKTALALAYRLSLNRVINDMMSTIKTRDLLILDEPTDGFSTEQLDKMRDVLSRLAVSQIIIVSHESKIEAFAEHIIRVSKQHHESTVHP